MPNRPPLHTFCPTYDGRYESVTGTMFVNRPIFSRICAYLETVTFLILFGWSLSIIKCEFITGHNIVNLHGTFIRQIYIFTFCEVEELTQFRSHSPTGRHTPRSPQSQKAHLKQNPENAFNSDTNRYNYFVPFPHLTSYVPS